jgi:hypothetical protein
MPACVNHPYQEAQQPCPDCGLPYCSACLVEFLGQRICGPCRDRRLAQMQGGAAPPTDAPLAGTGTVDIGGWTAAGWQIIKDDLLTFSLATLVAVLIGAGTCLIALPAMMAGLQMMAFRKMTTGYVEFGNLFDGFRRFGNALGTFLLLLLAGGAVGLVAAIPVFIVTLTTGEKSSATIATNLICQIISSVLSLVLSGATLFALPHVAARNAGPVEAITASITVARRNLPMFTALALIWQLLSQLGIVACCVGVFVTSSLVAAAEAKAYADHFGIRGWESS